MIKEVLSWLEVEDLKSCRLVNSVFEDMANKVLRNVAKLSITPDFLREFKKMDLEKLTPFFPTFIITNKTIRFVTVNDAFNLSLRKLSFLKKQVKNFKYFEICSLDLDTWSFSYRSSGNKTCLQINELRVNIEDDPHDEDDDDNDIDYFSFSIYFDMIKLTLIDYRKNKSLRLGLIETTIKDCARLEFIKIETFIKKTSYVIHIINLILKYPRISKIDLKFFLTNNKNDGNVDIIEIKTFTRFRDLEIKVFDKNSNDGTINDNNLSIFNHLNKFLIPFSKYVQKLSLCLDYKLSDSGWDRIKLPPLPPLPSCEELIFDIRINLLTSKLLKTSSFPTLRKIVTKSHPSVLACAKLIETVESIEVFDGFYSWREKKNWAASFPNCSELIIRNPSKKMLKSVMKDMKKLTSLKLIGVTANLWEPFAGKRKYFPNITKCRPPISLEYLQNLRILEVWVDKMGHKETIDGIIYMTLQQRMSHLDELKIVSRLKTPLLLTYATSEAKKQAVIKKLNNYHNTVTLEELK